MTLSVVIPAWCWDEKTVKLLRDCIDNLIDTASADTEIIVVYSGIEKGRSLRGMVDVWIDIEPAQGWAAQSNIGLLRASGDFLCVGSIDIRLPMAWDDKLCDPLMIVSPIDVKNGVRRVWDKTERGSFWGGWFVFPRRALEEVGYLDGYTMRRYADMDWAIRAKKLGWKTRRAKSVGAEHVAPHHAIEAHPDLHDPLILAKFRERHEGAAYLGEWERKHG